MLITLPGSRYKACLRKFVDSINLFSLKAVFSIV